MQYQAQSFWAQSGTAESIAADLRLANMLMDLSTTTRDPATAKECYEKARDAHDSLERLLRRDPPDSASARAELGAAIARLGRRLRAYESTGS